MSMSASKHHSMSPDFSLSRLSALLKGTVFKRQRSGSQFGAISVAGKNAVGAERNCKDAALVAVNGERTVLAVADGASFAEHGGVAAKTVCKTVCDRLARTDIEEGDALFDAFVTAVERSMFELENSHLPSAFPATHAFASTLITAVVCPNRCYLFHVGDGVAIVADRANNSILRISSPANGRSKRHTFFVSDPKWQSHLRAQVFEGDFNTVLLMTDGVTANAMNEQTGLCREGFVSEFNTVLQQGALDQSESRVRDWLASDAFMDKSSDDKSLAWWVKGTTR